MRQFLCLNGWSSSIIITIGLAESNAFEQNLPSADHTPIIIGVIRRVHVAKLISGTRIPLDEPQAHHLHSVLRLRPGEEVSVFDDDGFEGTGTLVELDARSAVIAVGPIERWVTHELTVAAAIPKGQRADWMVEKLSEIGIARWVPLLTDRGVVKAESEHKARRWARLADEAARQSRGMGIRRIDRPTPLSEALRELATGGAWVLSTSDDAQTISRALSVGGPPASIFIGPEGDWTPEELIAMHQAGLTAVSLGRTILRVETAAVVAAGIVMAAANGGRESIPVVTHRE